MEPTSEQELKQLLDEGRITEEDYKELLEAIRQKETVQEKRLMCRNNPPIPNPAPVTAKRHWFCLFCPSYCRLFR
jgi:hypothetical protein